jgi:hypothetical protein
MPLLVRRCPAQLRTPFPNRLVESDARRASASSRGREV